MSTAKGKGSESTVGAIGAASEATAERLTSVLRSLQGVELALKSLYTGVQGFALRAELQKLRNSVSKTAGRKYTLQKWLGDHGMRPTTLAVCELSLRWAVAHNLVEGMPTDWDATTAIPKGTVATYLKPLPEVTIHRGTFKCDLKLSKGATVTVEQGQKTVVKAFPGDVGVAEMYAMARSWWRDLHQVAGPQAALARAGQRQKDVAKSVKAMVSSISTTLALMDNTPSDEAAFLQESINPDFFRELRAFSMKVGTDADNLLLKPFFTEAEVAAQRKLAAASAKK